MLAGTRHYIECEGKNCQKAVDVPRYYSEGVTTALRENKKISCHIYNVEKNNNCNECIKLIMKIE